MRPVPELSGQVFGRWTVLKGLYPDSEGGTEMGLPLCLRHRALCFGTDVKIRRFFKLRMFAKRTGSKISCS